MENQYRLALAEEAAGDFAAARGHYQSFLDRWGNADAAIPAVDDAKRRLAVLQREN